MYMTMRMMRRLSNTMIMVEGMWTLRLSNMMIMVEGMRTGV